MSAIILHIPHASRHVPLDARQDLLVDDAALEQELLCMTDAWTDELVDGFRLPAVRVVAPVSRLVVDVERFPDDQHEPMAAKGMGAIYTHLSTGKPLRQSDRARRQRLLAQFYHPHHERLMQSVDAALEAHGRALILDIHSFSSVPLPHEPDQDAGRPEVCLGTDPFHAPIRDEQEALEVCREAGFKTAALNRPFAGGIVPARHWGRTREVRSVMLEVRRDLYVDERTGTKLPRGCYEPTASKAACFSMRQTKAMRCNPASVLA